VPSLGKLLRIQQETSSYFALSVQQDRLKASLTKMFQAISSKDNPIVFVLDDLQVRGKACTSISFCGRTTSYICDFSPALVSGLIQDRCISWRV